MPIAPYLRRRGGRHFVRIRTPHRLRELAPGGEVTRALGTSDPHEARRRSALAVAAIRAGYAIMENVRHAGVLSEAEERRLFRRLMDGAVDRPSVILEQQQILERLADPSALRRHALNMIELLLERVETVQDARAQAEQQAHAESDARAEAEERIAAEVDRTSKLETALNALAAASGGRTVELHDDHDKPVSALLDEFYARKELTTKTRKSYDKAFQRFLDVVGDKPLSQISKNDIVNYVERLEGTKSDKRNHDPLRPATVKKYLSHVKEFFADQAGKNRVRLDPTDGVQVTSKGSKEAAHNQRVPLTPEELKALLDAPIFRGCKSSARITRLGSYLCRDGRFWYGLVKMFTGARNGELEALSIDDVVKHHGFWHLDIRQAHKSEAGARLIPIHPALLKAGFLDWVAHRRQESEDGRLFERHRYGRIWNEQIMPGAGVKTEKNSVYSLRHNFDDGLKELVEDKTRQRLMGHSGQDMGSRYGNGKVTRAQAEAIKRLDLGEIDVSFLYKYKTVEEALAASEI